MRNLFDKLGKDIGLDALAPCGLTVAQDEISPGARYADLRHEPSLTAGADRARLGLLGRMASVLCLIEIYSSAPDEEEALSCVGKLIAFRESRRRDAVKARQMGRAGRKTARFVRPLLWLITAGRPRRVLLAAGVVPAVGWPRGVYFSPGALRRGGAHARDGELEDAGGLFRLGIVVAAELPRVRSTILVRLMAGGPLLLQAVADLKALPADAYERTLAQGNLLALHRALGKKAKRSEAEQEFIVSTQSIVESLIEKGRKQGLREGRSEGRAEGRSEGRAEGRSEGRADQARKVLRRILAMRGLAPDAKVEAQIDKCDELATLERWIDLALIAGSLREVFGPRRR